MERAQGRSCLRLAVLPSTMCRQLTQGGECELNHLQLRLAAILCEQTIITLAQLHR